MTNAADDQPVSTSPGETVAAAPSETAPASRPAWRSPLAWALLVGALAIGVTLDLASKALAFDWVAPAPVVLDRNEVINDPSWAPPPHAPIHVIPKVLDFKLVVNHGAVFGIGPGQRWFFIAFTVIAIAAGTALFALRTGARDHVTHVAIGLVLAGAAGNLYDRWTFGAVRDFLNLFPDVNLPFGWTWPGGNPEIFPWVFNIADSLLLIGVTLLIIRVGFEEREALIEAENEPQPALERGDTASAAAPPITDVEGN